MLHYQLKQVFDLVLISIVKNYDTVDAPLITDLITESNMDLVVQFWNTKGNRVRELTFSTELKPQSDMVLVKIPLKDIPCEIIHTHLIHNGSSIYTNVFIIKKFKDLEWNVPNLLFIRSR